MGVWLRLLACAGVLVLSSVAQGSEMVVYERAPLPQNVHPFLLLQSKQGVHLSALITERLSRLDAARNELVLTFVDRVEERSKRAYDLVLKEGLQWSDGSPLTAEDVAGSLVRLRDMASWDNPPVSALLLTRMLSLVERAEVVDRGTVRFHFRKPVNKPELPTLLAFLPVIPAKQTNKVLSGPGAVTCGPYVVKEVGEEQMRLEANQYYYLGKPRIDAVVIRGVDDEEVSKILFTEGTGEVAVNVPLKYLDRYKKRADLVIRPANTRRILYLGFNMQPGSLFARQPDLRMVVASIVNPRAVDTSVPRMGLDRSLVTGPFAQDSPYADPDVVPIPVSAAMASRRLADLGYRRVGERYRNARGQPLSFRLWVCSSVFEGDLIAKVIGEELERAGIGLEVETIDEKRFRSLLAGPRGDYDLILHEWMFDEGEDIFEVYHSRGLYNFLGYSNSKVDERLALGRWAALPETRVMYRREIHRLFMVDMPALFFWDTHDVVVFRSDVAHVPPLDPYFLFRDVHLWTVGEAGDAS